jgi:hypothetical protein
MLEGILVDVQDLDDEAIRDRFHLHCVRTPSDWYVYAMGAASAQLG